TGNRNTAERRYRDNRRYDTKVEYGYKGRRRALTVDFVNRPLIKSRRLEQSIGPPFLIESPLEIRERKPPQVHILEVRWKVRPRPGALARNPSQLSQVERSGRDDIADDGDPCRRFLSAHTHVVLNHVAISNAPVCRENHRTAYGADTRLPHSDFGIAS